MYSFSDPVSYENGQILQFYYELFIWYDEVGLMGGACYTLEQAKLELQKYGESL